VNTEGRRRGGGRKVGHDVAPVEWSISTSWPTL
jgi:hypothetical protein